MEILDVLRLESKMGRAAISVSKIISALIATDPDFHKMLVSCLTSREPSEGIFANIALHLDVHVLANRCCMIELASAMASLCRYENDEEI